MAEKLSITFLREKETPGTVRFQEEGDKTQHKIGTLYIKKAVAGTADVARVTVELA